MVRLLVTLLRLVDSVFFDSCAANLNAWDWGIRARPALAGHLLCACEAKPSDSIPSSPGA